MDRTSYLTKRGAVYCARIVVPEDRVSGLRGIMPPTHKGFGHFVLVDMIAAVMDGHASEK